EDARPQELRRLRLEIAERSLVDLDGGLDEEEWAECASFLLASGLKPAEWTQLWSALKLPEETQATALDVLLRLSLPRGEAQMLSLPTVFCELVKARRVRLRSLEEFFVHALPRSLAMDSPDRPTDWTAPLPSFYSGGADPGVEAGSSPWQCMRSVFAHCLVLLFPTSGDVGWGWARVGWTWATWWDCCQRCLGTAPPAVALAVFSAVLGLLRERAGGVPFADWELWKASQADDVENLINRLTSEAQPEPTTSIEHLLAQLGLSQLRVVPVLELSETEQEEQQELEPQQKEKLPSPEHQDKQSELADQEEQHKPQEENEVEQAELDPEQSWYASLVQQDAAIAAEEAPRPRRLLPRPKAKAAATVLQPLISEEPSEPSP
ncbi:unnamed protein product, partial [Polarella glacialis]